jgi:hypothetical protein
MYGFSGYGTNSYASPRQTSGNSVIAILAIVGTRTVTLFTNFLRTVVAFTNQNQDTPIA